MKFVIGPAARKDILRQYQYYLMEAGELVAARFLSGSQAAIARVCEQPEIGVSKKLKNLKLLGLRSWPVRGFPDIRLY